MTFPMTRSSSTGRQPRRGVLVLILLLFLSSSLATSAHWISTPHRLCSFHGTIEHGSVAELAPDIHGTPGGPVYRNEGRSHEECSLGPCARLETAPLPAMTVVSAPLVLGCAPAFLRDDPLPDSALFLLAPSRSPPAAAL